MLGPFAVRRFFPSSRSRCCLFDAKRTCLDQGELCEGGQLRNLDGDLNPCWFDFRSTSRRGMGGNEHTWEPKQDVVVVSRAEFVSKSYFKRGIIETWMGGESESLVRESCGSFLYRSGGCSITQRRTSAEISE